ncbi:MAG: DoxX family protein [Flavobacteriales bacterium]|nr:DoxX family protein [Flavobacteriales bacterium]
MNNWIRAGRVFLAVMFVFSALSKVISIGFFDGMVAELFLGQNWPEKESQYVWIQWFTRFVVAGELVLGVALLQNYRFKKLVLPAAILLLLLFTVHLFYSGITSEKGFIEGNCGCFGDILPMNNLESILKNVVAMLVGFFVWKKYKDEQQHGLAGWVAPLVVGLVTFGTLGFSVRYPYTPGVNEILTDSLFVDTSYHETIDTLANKQPVDTATKQPTKVTTDNVPNTVEAVKKIAVLSALDKFGNFSNNKKFDPSGTKLLCFFSMTCQHCQESFKELNEMKQMGGLPEMYLVDYGRENEQDYFFQQAGGYKPPHIRTEDYLSFNKLLEGKGFPRMLVIKNGKIAQEWGLDTYNKQVVMDYFGIKEKPKDDGLIKPKTGDTWGDDLDKKNPWE